MEGMGEAVVGGRPVEGPVPGRPPSRADLHTMVWAWLGEENARLLLLATLLLLYMGLGAVIFNLVEGEQGVVSEEMDEELKAEYESYLGLHPDLSPELLTALHRLIRAYTNTSAPLGWDFAGGFHFAATIVSTIGYGNRVPSTATGKVAVIVYGFLGCSGGILFFNLFLERIISALAYMLGYLHLRKLEKEGHNLRDEDPLEDWKPNVYLVFLCLMVASVVIGLSASFTFSYLEGWTFIESLYFCFVSFSTIGFGDYVTTQKVTYPSLPLYRFGNFVFIALGCCCIYSLFNVMSIMIKEGLNWILIRLDCQGCGRASDKATRMLRRHSLKIQHRARRRSSFSLPKNYRKKSDSGVSNTDSNGRRLSGEISMKEFLCGNKVSLAVMQKQLYEAAMVQKGYYSQDEDKDRFTPGMVGPLAIISNKLDTSK